MPTLFGFGLLLFIPCVLPNSGGWSGDDCLNAKCKFRSRLTSRATQGTAQRRQDTAQQFVVAEANLQVMPQP